MCIGHEKLKDLSIHTFTLVLTAAVCLLYLSHNTWVCIWSLEDDTHYVVLFLHELFVHGHSANWWLLYIMSLNGINKWCHIHALDNMSINLPCICSIFVPNEKLGYKWTRRMCFLMTFQPLCTEVKLIVLFLRYFYFLSFALLFSIFPGGCVRKITVCSFSPGNGDCQCWWFGFRPNCQNHVIPSPWNFRKGFEKEEKRQRNQRYVSTHTHTCHLMHYFSSHAILLCS